MRAVLPWLVLLGCGDRRPADSDASVVGVTCDPGMQPVSDPAVLQAWDAVKQRTVGTPQIAWAHGAPDPALDAWELRWEQGPRVGPSEQSLLVAGACAPVVRVWETVRLTLARDLHTDDGLDPDVALALEVVGRWDGEAWTWSAWGTLDQSLPEALIPWWYAQVESTVGPLEGEPVAWRRFEVTLDGTDAESVATVRATFALNGERPVLGQGPVTWTPAP